MAPRTFLDLPFEIRDIIYHYALARRYIRVPQPAERDAKKLWSNTFHSSEQSDSSETAKTPLMNSNDIVWRNDFVHLSEQQRQTLGEWPTAFPRLATGLFLTCRLVLDEALPVFYSTNTFMLECTMNWWPLYNFLCCIGPANVSHVLKLGVFNARPLHHDLHSASNRFEQPDYIEAID